MVQTIREELAKEEFERDGWKVLDKGAPDFLLIKYDNKENITDVAFCEIKSSSGPSKYLTDSQEEYIKALDFLDVNTQVKRISKIETRKRFSKGKSCVEKMIKELNLSNNILHEAKKITSEISRATTVGLIIGSICWILYKKDKKIPYNLTNLDLSTVTLRKNFNFISNLKGHKELKLSISKTEEEVKIKRKEKQKKDKKETQTKSWFKKCKEAINILE